MQIPDDMQGVTLMPLFNNTASDWRKSLYYHYYEAGEHNVPRHYGVRTDRYKLIHYSDTDEWELFDLDKDPQELKSVYDDPAYGKVRADLHEELKRLQRRYNTPEQSAK